MTEQPSYRLAQVFVVGQEPTVTYSARDAKRFETTVADYLDERGRILVVTGPSKSGKTVLLRKTVPDAIWLAGGQIESVSQFWRQIVDQTGGWTGEAKEVARTDTETTDSRTSAQFKPVGVGAESVLGDTDSVADSSRHERTVDREPQSVGLRILAETKEPLVVDDFHHMSPGLQRDIVRQLKPLLERALGVIFAAVPHHVADAVIAENEMESRVESLQIGLWDIEELAEIAYKGFREALRVDLSEDLAVELACHSFRSPHLMQLLCRELSKVNEIRETAAAPITVREPSDWDGFLAEIAVRHTDDQTYRDLARGPQSRKDRVPRAVKDRSETTDIYGALISAIRASGPAEELTYNRLRDILRDLLEELPQKEQITNPLKHMTAIAHRHACDEYGRLKRDPVLEWQPERDTLFIADPFLSFRVRHGPELKVHLGAAQERPQLAEGTPQLIGEQDIPSEEE